MTSTWPVSTTIEIRSPRGTELSAKSWMTEAPQGKRDRLQGQRAVVVRHERLGVGNDVMDVLRQVIAAEPPPIEHLAPHVQVEVLTTCARDARSWKNEYAEGPDRMRGVRVRLLLDDMNTAGGGA